MPRRIRPTYVMVALLIVQCFTTVVVSAEEGEKQTVPPHLRGPIAAPLPPAAEHMRAAILSAVDAGDIEELRYAYEISDEFHPDIADEPVRDPVAYWKAQSADGEGREILAIIGNVLSVGPARLSTGKDPENSAVYVWPYLAELPLEKLSARQKVDLYRLMPVAEANAMIKQKKWTWWTLTIGADGLWHAFKKGQ